MNATATGGLVFALTMAGILIGFWLRSRLPARQLDNDTQSSVRDVNGLIGTMTALVLGLVDEIGDLERAIEVAAELAMTPDAAKSLLYRARNQLRVSLEPLGAHTDD